MSILYPLAVIELIHLNHHESHAIAIVVGNAESLSNDAYFSTALIPARSVNSFDFSFGHSFVQILPR